MRKLFLLILFLPFLGMAQNTDTSLQNEASGIRAETTPQSITPLRLGNALLNMDKAHKNIDDTYTSTGVTTNLYEVTVNSGVVSYARDISFIMKAHATNTGASSIIVNGISGAKSIRKNGSVILAAGDITIGNMYLLSYDVANGWFQLISSGTGGGGGGSGWGSPTDPSGTLVDPWTIDGGEQVRFGETTPLEDFLVVATDGVVIGTITGNATLQSGADTVRLKSFSGPVGIQGNGLLLDKDPGTEGQVVTSHGPGVAPTWEVPSAGVEGTGVANEIPYWVNSSTLGSLAVATYPGLTELSYVKGVTSAIQTQLNAKQATLVSGTNIKTVGGTSLLGSGNVTEVTQTITNGVTTTAPSEDAVYDALVGVAGYTSTVPEIVSGSISGQAMKGRTLTANKYFRDIDGTAEGATTYQWVRANDAIGTGSADISGATSSTYVLATADNTKYIACRITPVNVTPESGIAFTTPYVGAVDDTYYPADQSNIVVSYGVKKMAAAYAGNCIRVQMTNGGATTNIGFDGNGNLDWAAVSTAASGGTQTAYLNIWYDQSGNGFNMTFASFAKQPIVNYTLKRIEWAATNDGLTTHNAAMNIGTGDFSFFMEAAPRSLKDITFTYFEKKTNFTTNNLQLYSPIGYGSLMYTGSAVSNSLVLKYSNPNVRAVMAGYRSSTAKFLNTDMQIATASETATNLTSTTDIKFNTGDGGSGEWYMWSWTLYTANKGADYSKYVKFVKPD